MPELPDVELFKRYLDATSLRQAIRAVQVTRDEILKDVSRRRLSDGLKGRQFCDSRRHGKYLAVALDDARQLVLHFGMSGRLNYLGADDAPSPHARMIIRFDNGHQLDYDNQRLLGRVRLVDDFDAFVERQKLGPDALDVDLATFDARLRKRRGAIKATLMNQHVIAGLGNIYSDEVLFQAGIHPKSATDALSPADRKNLYRMMRKVLCKAIAVEVDFDRLPRSYLSPHRQPGARCPGGRGEIERIRIGGRSTYFCSRCQVLRKA